MTSCWILYDRRDLAFNGFFAGRLLEACTDLGMCTRIVTTDDIPDHAPDALINRSRDAGIAERLESEGTRSFNSSLVTKVCNDKMATYRFADSISVPHMPASVPGEDAPPGPPWIIKSRSGHGGSEVFMAEDEDEMRRLCGTLRDPLVQSMAAPGRDMRVYVLGGRVLASVMRTSGSDFRANYKLGGKAELCRIPPAAEKCVSKVCEALEPDLVGVDFVFDEGIPVLNEIEDAVGTRMLYSLTSLDAAALLAEHVHSNMSL